METKNILGLELPAVKIEHSVNNQSIKDLRNAGFALIGLLTLGAILVRICQALLNRK